MPRPRTFDDATEDSLLAWWLAPRTVYQKAVTLGVGASVVKAAIQRARYRSDRRQRNARKNAS